MRDLYHNLSVTQALTPVVATSTQTSSAIDLKGYNSAAVVFAVGQSGDTLSGSVYWTLKLQHSDSSNSDYTDTETSDISSGTASVVIDASAEDEVAHSFGYIGTKRYLKAVATATGTHSNGTPLAVIALRGTPSYSPVA